eukprot:SAG31_NODE_6373_length_2040_cov_1.856260_1_plen_234_part_00
MTSCSQTGREVAPKKGFVPPMDRLYHLRQARCQPSSSSGGVPMEMRCVVVTDRFSRHVACSEVPSKDDCHRAIPTRRHGDAVAHSTVHCSQRDGRLVLSFCTTPRNKLGPDPTKSVRSHFRRRRAIFRSSVQRKAANLFVESNGLIVWVARGVPNRAGAEGTRNGVTSVATFVPAAGLSRLAGRWWGGTLRRVVRCHHPRLAEIALAAALPTRIVSCLSLWHLHCRHSRSTGR